MTVAIKIFLIALLALISACVSGAKGPFFHEVDRIEPDKAVIYIYSQYIPGMGVLGGYIVKANGSVVVRLFDGGYFPLQVDAGRVTLDVDLQEVTPLSLQVERGHSYFVRPYLIGCGYKCRQIELREVTDRDTAINEITSCRLNQS